jgi:mannosyltransferase OCH1-like enzyme
MYIDDDSDMKVPLDNMIEPLDQLVISKERNIFNGDMCYIPKYHLSDQATYKNNETRRSMNIFNSAVIPNWALASAPKHPILARTMENIVEVLKHEYIRDPVIRDLRHGYRWMCVMCSTGPSMLTASAREVVFENPPNLVYKLVATDFRDYGGKFKAVQTRQDSKHYTKQFQSGKISLLSSYLPEPPVTPEMLKEWDGEAIKSHSSKEIFLIKDGYRRGFPDFDTFIGMNYTTSNVRVITHTKLEKIPLGEPLLKIQ